MVRRERRDTSESGTKIPGNVSSHCLDLKLTLGIDVIKFPQNDLPQSIAAVELMNVSTDKKKKYFVVGSAVELAIEDEPREGWIRVYEIVEQGGRRRLRAFSEDKVSGSVYCVDECDGKLVCGIGSTVTLLSLFRLSVYLDGPVSDGSCEYMICLALG